VVKLNYLSINRHEREYNAFQSPSHPTPRWLPMLQHRAYGPRSHFTPKQSRKCGMARVSVFSGEAGYVLVHLSRINSRQPASRLARTASSISATVAIPVEITGFPVVETTRISGTSVFSKDAILQQRTSSFSRKSTAESSNGVLKCRTFRQSQMGCCLHRSF
jgi:hypothetical protein